MATEHGFRNNGEYSEHFFFILSMNAFHFVILLLNHICYPDTVHHWLRLLTPVKEKPVLKSLRVVFLLKYEKEMAVLMDFVLLALEEVQIGTQPTHTPLFQIDSILRHFFFW